MSPFPEIELRYVMPIPMGQTSESVCRATELEIVGATGFAQSCATLKGHTKTNNLRDIAPHEVSVCHVELDLNATQISFNYFGKQIS